MTATPKYLARTTTDLWSVNVAHDLIDNTPDAEPESLAWARHTLSLPVTGEKIASGERQGDDRPTGGSGNSGRGGSKPAIKATEKQYATLINMGAKKDIGDATVRFLTADLKVQDIVDKAATDKFVSKGEASAALDFLFAAPWKPRETAPAAARTSAPAAKKITEDGMYTLGERIIKVQIAKNGSQNLYAKELVGDAETGFGFEYMPGLINRMADATRMTLDEAAAFGRLYGVCCVCGRDLTDEKSISEGIGPICAKRI